MHLKKTCAIGFLLASVAPAQTTDELKSKIETLHYPPLAQSAQISGDVHLKVFGGAVTLMSGHPLLAPRATEHAKTLNAQTNLDVSYHFVIVDRVTIVPTSTTIKRGNAFERAFLHAFGFKTEKTVVSYQCDSGVALPNDVKANGDVIEIWIYGRTFCLQTNTATLVATR